MEKNAFRCSSSSSHLFLPSVSGDTHSEREREKKRERESRERERRERERSERERERQRERQKHLLRICPNLCLHPLLTLPQLGFHSTHYLLCTVQLPDSARSLLAQLHELLAGLGASSGEGLAPVTC